MNIRRGMNRLFIVLWTVYVLGLALYAWRETVRFDETVARSGLSDCELGARDAFKTCLDGIAPKVEAARGEHYREIRRPAWIGMALFVVVIPPLAVYGVAFLAVKIALWIAAGFDAR